MNRGDKVKLDGYELMAVINYVSAASRAVVVHNHSTHILIFRVDIEEGDNPELLMEGEGVYVAAFRYFDAPGDFNKVYGPAVRLALNVALGEADDAS